MKKIELFRVDGLELNRKQFLINEVLRENGLKPDLPTADDLIPIYANLVKVYSGLLVQVKGLVDGWNGFHDEAGLVLESIREVLEEEAQKKG